MFVRAIRFILLLIVLAVAFIATPTFELYSFASLLPTDLLADSSFQQQFRHWVTEDVAPISVLLTGCAALTFGLLTAPWPANTIAAPLFSAGSQPDRTINRRRRRRRWAGMSLIVPAMAGTVGALFLQQQIGEQTTVHLLWVGSILLLLWATALLTPLSTPANLVGAPHAAGDNTFARPSSGWRSLVFVLLFAMLIYSWKLKTTPAVVDDSVAQLGIQALDLARGESPALFTVQSILSQPDNQLFTVALTPTALLFWVTGDLLLSTRLIGLVAALLCATATWLVAVELFARRPTPPNAIVPLEDNGHAPAMIATLLVIFNIAVLYFSRRPVLLEATAWGTLGCWALLRGMRTRDRLAIGLSGLLLGLGYIFHGGAVAFVLTALFWWLGFGAAQMGMLPHLARAPRAGRLHGGDFVLWLLGILVMTAPFLVARSQEVIFWFSQFPSSADNALTTLLSDFAPGITAYPTPLYNLVLLPLFPLTVGVLLFHLDRRLGWMIGSWISSALLVAALVHPQNLHWEMLLPLVPASALALAFMLDRLRVTLVRVGGRWTQQFLAYLLLGLMLWVGFQNVTTYYTFALRQSDPTSAIGYALRTLPADQAVLVRIAPADAALSTLVAETAAARLPLRFLTNDTIDRNTNHVRFVEELPIVIEPGAIVIFFPEDTTTLAYLRSTYPTGSLVVRRDLLANPLLNLYTVPGRER